MKDAHGHKIRLDWVLRLIGKTGVLAAFPRCISLMANNLQATGCSGRGLGVRGRDQGELYATAVCVALPRKRSVMI